MACSEQCPTCKDRADFCTSCKSGTFLITPLGKCDVNCPKGTFADATTGKCTPCHESCDTCKNTEKNGCVTCKEFYTLKNGECNIGFLPSPAPSVVPSPSPIPANKCETTTPSSLNDCITNSDSTNYCCIQTNQAKVSKCVPMARSAAVKAFDNINNDLNIIDCGVTKSTNPTENKNTLVLDLTSCGNAPYSTVDECKASTLQTNSCCLFKSDLGTGCYSLGVSYTGTANYKDTIAITCNGQWINNIMMLLALCFLALWI
jgi:hypothetical protein